MITRGAPPAGASSAPGVREPLLLLAAGALFLVLFQLHHVTSPERFIYDEADYMTAARMGFRENYLETSSMSFPAFVRTGLEAYSGKIDRVELSEHVRHRGDVSFYRHYHGPLYFHWLILVTRVSDRDAWVRAAGLGFHLLAFVTVFAGIVWLMGPEARPAAWLASLAYLFNVTSVKTSLGVSTHQMYAWLAVLTLFLIGRFLQKGTSASLLASIAGVTVALCTLEYGIFLLAILVLCTILQRRRLLAANPALASRGPWLKALGLFLALTAVVWPAGLLKLSMLKGFLTMPYLALARNDSFGLVSPGELWSQRLRESPLEYLVLLACLAAGVHVLRRHRRWPHLVPFVLYALLILGITAKSDTDRYMSSALPPLYVVGGVVGAALVRKAGMPPRRVATAAVAGIALLALSATQAIGRQGPTLPASDDDLVAFVAGRRDRLRAVLVPAGWVPTLHYYVPEVRLRTYLPERGSEHVMTRLAAAPVDALIVDCGADERLRLELDRRLGGARAAAGEGLRPECDRFIVYLFEGNLPRQAAALSTASLRP